MKTETATYFSKIVVLWFGLTSLIACNQQENATVDGAPQQPPVSSMASNFDVFPQDNATLLSSKSSTSDPAITAAAVTTRSNFTYAAINVAVWNTLLKIGLVVPVTAFRESFHHQPSLRSDNTWVWSYTVKVDDIIHTAELHAFIMEENIQWDMYITKPGYYLDFNWFSGESALDGSDGFWVLRENPESPNPVLRIDWSYDHQDQTGQVTYTNVKPGDVENGAYISYGNNAFLPYDAFYDIYNKRTNEFVEIEWSLATHEGRVKNPAHFNDLDWHYWDNFLRDSPAP